MATLRNKRKLAAVTREVDEEHPRNGQSRNTSVPRINMEYITKVSGTVPGTFRNKNVESKESNENQSQDDPHPEVGPSVCQSRHSIDSGTDEAPHNFPLLIFENLKILFLWPL